MDWSTVVGTLAGTALGGALTLINQALVNRSQRQHARLAKADEAAAGVQETLAWFDRAIRADLDPYRPNYAAELDTAEPPYTDRLDQLRAQTALINNKKLRSRLGEIALVIGFIASIAQRLKTGETYGYIAAVTLEEGQELVAAYLRGDRLPKRSALLARCYAIAQERLVSQKRQLQADIEDRRRRLLREDLKRYLAVELHKQGVAEELAEEIAKHTAEHLPDDTPPPSTGL